MTTTLGAKVPTSNSTDNLPIGAYLMNSLDKTAVEVARVVYWFTLATNEDSIGRW